MATIHPRATWTNQPKGFTRISNRRRNPANVVIIAPHYPAVGNITIGVETLAQSCARLRGWRSMHISVNGWADLGYDYAIDQAGRIFECSGHTHATAHALNNNFTAVGVLFIVGNNEAPSAAARAAFRALGAHLKRNAFPNLRTRPVDHGNLAGNSTSCAGQPIRRIIPDGLLDIGGTAPVTVGGGNTVAPGQTYTVRAGDTLSQIAAAHGVSISDLASVNRIANINLIRVGQKLTIPGRASTPAKGNTGGSKTSGPVNLSGQTSWPRRKIDPNPFQARSNPFTGARGLPLDNWFDTVTVAVKAALSESLRRAGYPAQGNTKWRLEEQIRTWMRARHRRFTERADVRRYGNNNAYGNPRSIWASFQAYLASQGHYKGAIDGQPGAQTWWAIVEWLNNIRPAYN
ncbi:LysM peptidoglycan-binding domain-containing protein [Nesterenkonia rhizosphaerae]|uniref:LysM domain-containing protein n=1 Tax=Nesterenkonia rhizosphaerae TaxID=1348272 RepID=A0ABP9FTQ2_9MICC